MIRKIFLINRNIFIILPKITIEKLSLLRRAWLCSKIDFVTKLNELMLRNQIDSLGQNYRNESHDIIHRILLATDLVIAILFKCL